MRSPAWQIAGIALACAFVGAINWRGDGLWFQGDSPRHAMNGLFFWDLVAMRPRDVVAFAVSYYARYPVIAPATYPPLFYLVEGLAFRIAGPSPHVAKAIVLLCAAVAGVYTTAWARRWQSPEAGWAGTFLMFDPGIVIWSNTIMLNVPATAAGLAVLYHFRRWSDESTPRPPALTALFVAVLALTYYPGLAALAVCAAWTVTVRGRRFDRPLLIGAVAVSIALIPLAVSIVVIPVHTARQWPTLAYLANAATWTFYWTRLPDVVGRTALTLGAAGLGTAVWRTRSSEGPRRREARALILWIVTLAGVLSMLPAKDPRYMLLVAPAFVLAAALGIAMAIERLPAAWPAAQSIVLIAAIIVAGWSASRVMVPQVSGFREVASYLTRQAPADAVLYDGAHDGVFGFYLRALDPGFERRMVRADKLLFQFGPARTFDWVQTSNVSSADDVVRLLRERAGCRWVAIEVGPREPTAIARRLLRQAVTRSGFELVRSFPIAGAGDRHVDLYRMSGDIAPSASADLSFPAFSDRTFRGVVPIAR